MHDPKPSWLRSLMKTLGDARDLDVVLSDVIAPVVRCNPHQANVAKLIEIVGQRQTKARSNVARALDAPDHGLHLLAIQSQLQTAANQKEVTNTKLENFADQRLRHLRKKVLGLADNRIAEDPQSLHRLRIAAKRLRYALEFFSTLQKGKRIANLIKQLAKLQNTLGRLNDLSNAELILLDCAGNDPDLLQAVNFIGNAHRQSRAELVDEASRLLAKFRSMDFPIFGE